MCNVAHALCLLQRTAGGVWVAGVCFVCSSAFEGPVCLAGGSLGLPYTLDWLWLCTRVLAGCCSHSFCMSSCTSRTHLAGLHTSQAGSSAWRSHSSPHSFSSSKLQQLSAACAVLISGSGLVGPPHPPQGACWGQAGFRDLLGSGVQGALTPICDQPFAPWWQLFPPCVGLATCGPQS